MARRIVRQSELLGRNTPGLVRRDAADTSRDAAASVVTGAARLLVHDHFVRVGTRGALDEEVSVATGLSPNTARPRRIELVDLGLLVNSGRKRAPAPGRKKAIVWVLTELSSR